MKVNSVFKEKGIQNVYDEIIQEINLEADEILKEGERKAEYLKNEIMAQINKEIEEITLKAKNIGELRKNKIISSSEIEAKRINLTKKNELIEKIFDMAIEKLKDFQRNNPKYREFLVKNIKQGIESVLSFKKSQVESKLDEIKKFVYEMKLSTNVGMEKIDIKILVNESDKAYLADTRLNYLMSEYKTNITIEIDNKIIGGAIISTLDGSVLLNNTFSERLNTKKLAIIDEISEMFWS